VTPELVMPIDQYAGDETTWRWSVRCVNGGCWMKPVSPHENLRKGQKKSRGWIFKRLQELERVWNTGNAGVAYEKKVVDISGLTGQVEK
jgi:hypothetical protein